MFLVKNSRFRWQAGEKGTPMTREGNAKGLDVQELLVGQEDFLRTVVQRVVQQVLESGV